MSNVYTHSDFVVVSIMKSFDGSNTWRGATIYYQKSIAEQGTVSFMARGDIREEDVDNLDRFVANVVPRIEYALSISEDFTIANTDISVKSYNTVGVEQS